MLFGPQISVFLKMLEYTPLSWSKSNAGGVTMFSAKIKQQVLSEYLQGTLLLLLMKKYGIKGLENCFKKTFYDCSFKINVIKWR